MYKYESVGPYGTWLRLAVVRIRGDETVIGYLKVYVIREILDFFSRPSIWLYCQAVLHRRRPHLEPPLLIRSPVRQ